MGERSAVENEVSLRPHREAAAEVVGDVVNKQGYGEGGGAKKLVNDLETVLHCGGLVDGDVSAERPLIPVRGKREKMRYQTFSRI